MDEEAYRSLALDPKPTNGWHELDRIYSSTRRRLYADPDWRYGPPRVHEVAKEGFDALQPYMSVEGKVYCDLGCGAYHPYGVSAAMFLNGAARTIALDLQDSERERAAEALADLLCDCLVHPEQWHWSAVAREHFFEAIRVFDLKALQKGQLATGLARAPLKHVVSDIYTGAIRLLEEDSIDIMSSRAVLEHFLDFGSAVKRLFDVMRKGGVAYHHIDLVDHRAYEDPRYHWWSFLAEGENWSDGLVNRLRSSEIRSHLENVGFEILRFENRMGKMPEGFARQLRGRFRDMPEAELNVITVSCVLRKA